ncbi:MAG: hypothetical protein ACK5MR_18225 [Cumulibacter sp.]
MVTIGFLHTARTHISTFDGLVRASSPSTETVHVVAEDLRTRARTSGPRPDLLVDMQSALAELADLGADVAICTCSTVGPLVEQSSAAIPVLRVDRPMARAAVRAGSRIAVVAALESTLLPTTALLTEEATEASRQ